MPYVHMYLGNAVIEGGLAHEDGLALLPGREVVRSQLLGSDYTVVTMDMSDAPPNAAVMTPWFSWHDDGPATLGGIEYFDADWHRLVREP